MAVRTTGQEAVSPCAEGMFRTCKKKFIKRSGSTVLAPLIETSNGPTPE